ncbi:hypothetical protein GGQ68_001741 [Sagittula marina]|uniref:Uncharacterized protein n=1 Tax=Sagittula marina TaxID=943940 RepID=A0A7W6GS45_9RHOB|nr:hypothetical protein [Sagittula marina]
MPRLQLAWGDPQVCRQARIGRRAGHRLSLSSGVNSLPLRHVCLPVPKFH